MALKFQKASKAKAKARVDLIGPSGSGKTWHALEIATELVGPGGKIALIDTEHESASKYADRFAFDTLNLESFSPRNYIEAIKAAADGGYDALIIDSLSHAWMGKDGALEMASAAEKRSGNKFASWRDVSPEVVRLIESILHSPMHVISTMRSKTEYSLEKDERGKTVPKKVGMGAIFKSEGEYEFDVVGELNQDNEVVITKTRCADLNEKVFKRDGTGIGKILSKWLSDGVEPTHVPAPVPTTPAQDFVAAAKETFGSDTAATISAPDPLAIWREKVEAADSVAALKALGNELRGLTTPEQVAISGLYKTRLAQLNAAGA